MKLAKKALAILLSAMMLTTLIPMSAFAAETNEVVEIPDEEFIEEAAEAPDESSYDDFDETPDETQYDEPVYEETAVEEADSETEVADSGTEAAYSETEEDNSEIEAAVEEPLEDPVEVGLTPAGGERKNAEEADFETAQEIGLNEAVQVGFSDGQKSALFKYTPEESGMYVFISRDYVDADPYGYIYNSEYEVIGSNDDGGGERNFSAEQYLEAGMIYYFEASLYGDPEESSSYYVSIAREYCVTYHANGGSLKQDSFEEEESVYVIAGDPLNTEYRGYMDGKAFCGWYADDPECNEENRVLLGELILNRDMTLYAKYTDGVAVTLDAGEEGYFGYDDEVGYIKEKTIYVSEEAPLDLYQYQPSYENGGSFKKWVYEDGGEVENESFFYTDTPVKLVAIKRGLCTVTFDAGQGFFRDTNEPTYSVKVMDGERFYDYGSVPSAPKANDLHYIFNQWYTDEDRTEPITEGEIDEMVITGDTVIYAGYTPANVVTIEAGDNGYILENGSDAHLTEASFSLAEGENVDLEYLSPYDLALKACK
ncbi:MAG: InlB B-repeat-containing protein [Blautia sp.]|nr:InlB B-repeat-containing protein [Blautia sp.]